MAMVKAESMALPAKGFFALPLVRQLGLMVGLAASVAIGVAVVLWAQEPDHRMLYANLNTQDSAAIVESLRKAGIDHSLADGTATVLVPANRVHEARLLLAGEGLPRGVGSGFELLDNQKGFGVSQFMENARYQRALEGELAMTISAISSVRGARVHLAIPRQTAFARNQKRPSASVMLDMYPGRSLSEAQAAAISHLVASSIPNMDADRVTIIDQNGRLLTPESDQDMRLSATQFEYRRRVEESYIKRIEDILTPIMGPGAVKAQVNADIDFTVTEQTQEIFSPDERVRSEQLVEETVSGGRLPLGVPGSLSNQPPGEGVGAEEAAASGSSSRRNVRNYELDKTISHSRMGGGVIRRLSAAVVVDYRTVPGEDGAPVRASLSEEEMERITALVREALGFEAERGDSVNVVNAPFSMPAESGIEEAPEASLFERLDVAGMLKQAAALVVVLFLVLGVLRPVLRDLAARGGRLPSAPALPVGDAGQLAEDQLTLGGPAATAALPKAAPSFEEKLDAIRSLAASDPKRVAQVVRNWVATE
jgi:flagellar M-ring protein FliF